MPLVGRMVLPIQSLADDVQQRPASGFEVVVVRLRIVVFHRIAPVAFRPVSLGTVDWTIPPPQSCAVQRERSTESSSRVHLTRRFRTLIHLTGQSGPASLDRCRCRSILRRMRVGAHVRRR